MLTGRLSAQLPCSSHSFLLKKEPPGCVDLKNRYLEGGHFRTCQQLIN